MRVYHRIMRRKVSDGMKNSVDLSDHPISLNLDYTACPDLKIISVYNSYSTGHTRLTNNLHEIIQ